MRKLLVVGMDGLNWPVVEAADMPVLKGLAAAGAVGHSLVPCPPVAESSSGPGWSTIATGVWPGRHGVRDNGFAGARYGEFPDFLTRVSPRYRTYSAVGWAELHRQGTFGPAVGVRVTFDGEADGYDSADASVTADACGRLRDVDAAFVYLGHTDDVAHTVGTGAAYRAAAEEQDRQLGRLLATNGPGEWLVIVTTDHGHRVPDGGHGGCREDERATWIVAAGPGIPAGARPSGTGQVDVAATALYHFELTAELDGRPWQEAMR
ncbi:alkaline phosphatase family protein [Dactylosporangium sp. AC04546]|uniref:alkaline phosphatase family protein n=1 Tax=Dactylosporangium sp. AC04546 TaxID=2862460 RepID=UPI001EDDCE02|nr:alkaline phosphatase family protein [Dactylosporangium sp. AC04546]WVK87680.1 alkaline phosphatase family protein [Dactylosporangium sp. AC04546]